MENVSKKQYYNKLFFNKFQKTKQKKTYFKHYSKKKKQLKYKVKKLFEVNFCNNNNIDIIYNDKLFRVTNLILIGKKT